MLVATGPAIAQGRSDTAPGKTKDKTENGSSTSSARRLHRARRRAASRRRSRRPLRRARPPRPRTPSRTTARGSMTRPWWRRATSGSGSRPGTGAATATGKSMRRSSSAAVGITPRVQAGGSASFYHFRDAEGISENGFGSFSLYGKFLIADPLRAPNAIGVAITPLARILSRQRVAGGLGSSGECRNATWRPRGLRVRQAISRGDRSSPRPVLMCPSARAFPSTPRSANPMRAQAPIKRPSVSAPRSA